MKTMHLTDAQFSECLTAGVPGAAIQGHLAECDACREELGVFLASMEDFSAGAMDWSKAQPVPSLTRKVARAPRGMTAPLRWAIAALLVAAVGVPVAVHRDRANVPVAAEDAGDSAAQIARDNRLLEQVNVALGENDLSPYQEYGLGPEKSERGRAHMRVE